MTKMFKIKQNMADKWRVIKENKSALVRGWLSSIVTVCILLLSLSINHKYHASVSTFKIVFFTFLSVVVWNFVWEIWQDICMLQNRDRLNKNNDKEVLTILLNWLTLDQNARFIRLTVAVALLAATMAYIVIDRPTTVKPLAPPIDNHILIYNVIIYSKPKYF